MVWRDLLWGASEEEVHVWVVHENVVFKTGCLHLAPLMLERQVHRRCSSRGFSRAPASNGTESVARNTEARQGRFQHVLMSALPCDEKKIPG